MVMVVVCYLPNVTAGLLEGVQVETTVSEIAIFVSSTSNFNIIALEHMKKLKNNTFVGNTRHFDNEIDSASSECLEGMKMTTSSLCVLFWLRHSPSVLRDVVFLVEPGADAD